jgi:SlyX protein
MICAPFSRLPFMAQASRPRAAMKGRRMDKFEVMEERMAHLIRTVDEVSDIVAAQQKEIARLSRLVGLLVEREAEREATAGEAPSANVPPPHW